MLSSCGASVNFQENFWTWLNVPGRGVLSTKDSMGHTSMGSRSASWYIQMIPYKMQNEWVDFSKFQVSPNLSQGILEKSWKLGCFCSKSIVGPIGIMDLKNGYLYGLLSNSPVALLSTKTKLEYSPRLNVICSQFWYVNTVKYFDIGQNLQFLVKNFLKL